MKGQVWSYGGILLVIILTSLALTKISAVGNVKRNIATVDGKMISFVNYADLLIKTFNVSIDFISQRAAYDLGKVGGIDGFEVSVWNSTYPSIGTLKMQLENKIRENLPKDTIENGRVVNWGDSNIYVNIPRLDGDADYDGDVDNDDKNILNAAYGSSPGDLNWNSDCDFNYDEHIDILDAVLLGSNFGKSGPTLSDSKSFLVNGTKSFSIYDKSIDSRILVNHKINHNISSSYFNLLYIGRQIVENPIYSSLLGDMTALKNLLQIDFPDLDFQISSSLGSDSSLVGYWAFDEGLGNIVKDFSSYGNDGSLVNGPIWINGKFGKALQFDSTDDYVEIPDNPSLRAENNKITLVMWFKRNKIPTGVQCLINKIGDGPDTVFTDYNVTYYISVPSSGSSSGGVITEFNSQFSYFIAYGSYSFTESVDFGLIRDYNWHHLAETYDGNILKSYLDGSLISTKVTTTKKMPLNDQPVRIGGDIILHNYFNGTIDEMKIYSRALSENEIKEEYNSVPQNEIEITIEDRSCLPNDFYCLAPLKPGEGGIIVDGKQIPYDYLKLTFKTSGNFISPSGVDFGVSVSPLDNTIVQGDVAKPTVNVGGISTSPITLSITGCPAGATCQFSQTTGVPSFSPTLTIANAPLGTHTMTITGTNGTTTHSATYSLTVSSVACHCSPGTPDETNCGSCAGAATSKQPSWCDAMGNWVSDQCGATRYDCSCPLGKTCNAATGACCTPTTCSSLGKNCGSWPDGCGNTLNCGTCLAGQTCNNGVCCNPKTCAAYPGQCGSFSDGCGGTITCNCPGGQTCTSGICIGCTRNSDCNDINPCTSDICNIVGGTCSNLDLPDGTLCDGPGKTCQSGICTCVPKTCVNYLGQCGSLSDGCGGTIICNCPLGENCVSGTCIPSCTPTTCAALGKNCGSWPDGCGGTLNCGTCSAPLTCSNGVCVCQCSDGTPCGQCAITDAFKPSWCDNNGNWVANQCNAPHSCQCPGASPICKLDGSCRPRGMGCFCDWNMEYACGISPNTHAECRIAIWWYAWWKKCECEDSVGDSNPGCGQIYGITCGGFPEYTEICRNSLWPIIDPACECTSCPS